MIQWRWLSLLLISFVTLFHVFASFEGEKGRFGARVTHCWIATKEEEGVKGTSMCNAQEFDTTWNVTFIAIGRGGFATYDTDEGDTLL